MLLSIYYIQVCTYVVFLISHLVLLCESKGGGRDMEGDYGEGDDGEEGEEGEEEKERKE